MTEKIQPKRLKELIGVIAMAFYLKIKEKEEIESINDGIIDCIDETFKSANVLTQMTFRESLTLLNRHMQDIANKIVDLAHHDNPSHDCKTCALKQLCQLDEEAQARLKTFRAVKKLNAILNGSKGGEA